MLERQDYAGRLAALLEGEEGRLRCQAVLDICRDTLDSLCPPPEEGWLKGTYQFACANMFPHPDNDWTSTSSRRRRPEPFPAPGSMPASPPPTGGNMSMR